LHEISHLLILLLLGGDGVIHWSLLDTGTGFPFNIKIFWVEITKAPKAPKDLFYVFLSGGVGTALILLPLLIFALKKRREYALAVTLVILSQLIYGLSEGIAYLMRVLLL